MNNNFISPPPSSLISKVRNVCMLSFCISLSSLSGYLDIALHLQYNAAERNADL